ncbi:NUDIX family pyrophosphatase [Burkholderiales bacterium GJ-E10]|nr:NUDIX family pyrophosphatase [Burkholderiales bacterium GJ-E10]
MPDDSVIPPSRPTTHVAVGVLVRGDGAVLLADRPEGKPYAGYWEFPGGKIEPGESVEAALARELHEELGLHVRASEPWTVIEHDYPHAYVRLYFRRVFAWDGVPEPKEGQRLRFHAPDAPPPQPLLPAAIPALRWAQLPSMTILSPGDLPDGAAVRQWIDDRLGRGARQLLVREPRLRVADALPALRAGAQQARAYGAHLLVDWSGCGGDAGADWQGGVVRAAQALRDDAPDRRNTACRTDPEAWFGGGVRDRSDLVRAAASGCDFAVMEAEVGRVPDWEAIAELCRESPLPVYVPLAPSAPTLARARSLGAQGLIWPA